MRGATWLPEEDARLLALFDQGADLPTIAAAHDRSANAIVGRLVRLGRLALVGRAYHRVEEQPYASFEDIRQHQGQSC